MNSIQYMPREIRLSDYIDLEKSNRLKILIYEKAGIIPHEQMLELNRWFYRLQCLQQQIKDFNILEISRKYLVKNYNAIIELVEVKICFLLLQNF